MVSEESNGLVSKEEILATACLMGWRVSSTTIGTSIIHLDHNDKIVIRVDVTYILYNSLRSDCPVTRERLNIIIEKGYYTKGYYTKNPLIENLR